MKTRKLQISPSMRSRNMLEAAKAYTGAGWKILALHGIKADGRCTCSDRNCNHPGKHPISDIYPHGVKDATREIGKFQKALRKYPDANIAVALADMTVVDIDGPKGKDAIAALNLPVTATAMTRRGTHLFFSGELRRSVKETELDILTGSRRYVILPPSKRTDGRQYRWRFAREEIVTIPSQLVMFAEADHDNNGVHIPALEEKHIPQGQRNDTLFRIAGSLRARGLDDTTIFDALKVINQSACKPPLTSRELRAIAGSSGRYRSNNVNLFGAPDQRDPLPMEHLWYPYIPKHGVTLIAGDPGSGKSLLAALLCGIVTSGGKLPESEERAVGKRVLILSAEDSWARTTLPRFYKAGGDIEQVHVMNQFKALNDEILEAFAREMDAWGPALVVIDTISAYMGGARDMHRQNEVGEFLAALSGIAERYDSAIVALAHLNKQGNEHPLYRIVGSIGFAASVRSVLFFGANPDNENQLLLAHGKVNGSEKGKTIIFNKVGGGRSDVPKLKAVGFSDATELDACRHSTNAVGRPNVEQERCVSFILRHLTDAPMPWTKLAQRAEAESISNGTLNLVRMRLAKDGVISQIGRGPSARWALNTSRSSESK